jgi:hypothetical protein
MTRSLEPYDRMPGGAHERLPENYPNERVSLVDLLDRVLAEGVVIAGDITLSIADVDLVTVSLRALLGSVSSLIEHDVPVPGGVVHADSEVISDEPLEER